MEKSFGEIAEKISQFIMKKCYAAFMDGDGNLLYSSLSNESEETLKKLAEVFPFWELGDYQLKKLGKSNLIVYKVSLNTILALESYEREGILIVTAKRLEENYADWFRDLEDQLPALQVKEVSEAPSEESSPGGVQEVSSTEETEKMGESIPQKESKLNEAKKRMKRMW
ncbi:MAG: hypothetical protein ACETWM_12265 [Candidatus Lokiarchaeia archaeon]